MLYYTQETGKGFPEGVLVGDITLILGTKATVEITFPKSATLDLPEVKFHH